jgi:hypothetical protein
VLQLTEVAAAAAPLLPAAAADIHLFRVFQQLLPRHVPVPNQSNTRRWTVLLDVVSYVTDD